jgi:hypothetical protein
VCKLLVAMLAAAALFPGSAEAKEGIERLTVCGASGCRSFNDSRVIGPLIAGLLGTEAQPAPPTEGFFTLVPRATAGWPYTWPRYVYAPEAQLVRQAHRRGHAEWYPLVWASDGYAWATQGLTPFPAPVSWSKLRTPARQQVEADPLPRAIGTAVALVVLSGVGLGALRRRRRASPD